MSRRRRFPRRPYHSLLAAANVHAQIGADEAPEHEPGEPEQSARTTSQRGKSAKTQRRNDEGKFV